MKNSERRKKNEAYLEFAQAIWSVHKSKAQ